MVVGHVPQVAPDAPQTATTLTQQAREALCWVGLVGVGIAATAAVGLANVELGTSASPLRGQWSPLPPRLSPAVLLPVAAAATVLLVNWQLVNGQPAAGRARPRWPWMLVLAYAGALTWALALAFAAGSDLDGALAVPADLRAAVAVVGDGPGAYLDRLTEPGRGPVGAAGQGHPPGAVVLLWGVTRLGVSSPSVLGLLLTALGAATVPLVLVAARSLCHETAARRLVPVLALAPWAAWTVASPEAVTAALAAAGVAVGVVGSEPGRRPWWALASGLLLGLTGLFSFLAPWLGTAVAATYFVRRRPLLNAITGLGALVPLFAGYAVGFSWPDSLGLSRAAGLVGTTWQSWVAWSVLNLVVVVLVTGPVLVRAGRRVRLTPGWPLLVGAGAAALFSLAAGLAHGGVERSWLPLLPWLLVPALAPRPRPANRGDTVQAGDVPVLLVAVGAASAVALRICFVPG